MVRLKPHWPRLQPFFPPVFTFHYGSIKTQFDPSVYINLLTLHSTMVRLKQTEKNKKGVISKLYIPLWFD